MALALLFGACAPSVDPNGGSGGKAKSANAGSSLPPMSGPNVLALTVNGSLCASGSYHNKPCVSVTVCSADGSVCQTVDDILLDTGSFGLRVFKSVLDGRLQTSLAPMTQSGQAVAECVEFGDGSSLWGPVASARVILGEEPAVQVPIQTVDAGFGTPPSNCASGDRSPGEAGFNGILGVGLLAQDCGSACASITNNHVYFACVGSTCSGVKVALANQVQNPVTLLPRDNNGVIVELPGVSLGGQAYANGYLVLGIGTQPNNAPSGVTRYAANAFFGEFTTSFGGKTYDSFLDSGSNALFFPAQPDIPVCATGNDGGFAQWYCPVSILNLTASNTGASGSGSGAVAFQIGNLLSLASTPNSVFTEIGAAAGGEFDWGLPFFFGRNVYVGIEGKSSGLGTGPYWAY